jgi:Zn-dependent peptidase ImmA (M78 family)
MFSEIGTSSAFVKGGAEVDLTAVRGESRSQYYSKSSIDFVLNKVVESTKHKITTEETKMVLQENPINHDILAWARREANLSPERAAIKAHIKDLKARGSSKALLSIQRLELWEQGIETPTFPQLENLAKAYRRPVLTFFLHERPTKQTRVQDFRTIGSKDIDTREFSPEFSALLRQIEALQVSLKDLMEKIGQKQSRFVGSGAGKTNSIEVAQIIRNYLGYSLENQYKAGSYDQVFSDVRAKAEEQGVFVILEGNLGSYHTDFEPDVFRGLSISDPLAPLVVINPNDSKAARIFTIVHELCHICKGETGVSNWNSLDVSLKETTFKNEVFCDQVAAEFLIPKEELEKDWKTQTSIHSFETAIEHISKHYWVSKIVVARRLYDFGKIEKDYYWKFYEKCLTEWKALANKKKTTPKIPAKIKIKNKFGIGVLGKVIGATRQGKISEIEASRMLNIKLVHFSELLQ